MPPAKKKGALPLEVAWVGSDTAYVTWYADPLLKRKVRIIDKCHYAAWEASLPKAIRVIRLCCYDQRIGPSSARWQDLGYLFVWTDEEMEKALSEGVDPLDFSSEMVKERTLFPR